MIKFLLYLLLFYVVFRLLFGRVTGSATRTKVYHNDTHHHHHYAKNEGKPEGTITVDPRTVKPKKDDKTLGDYVDYEEVK